MIFVSRPAPPLPYPAAVQTSSAIRPAAAGANRRGSGSASGSPPAAPRAAGPAAAARTRAAARRRPRSRRGVVDRRLDGAGADNGDPVVEPYLDGDRAAAPAATAEAVAELARHLAQVLELLMVRHVGFEGPLGGERLGDARLGVDLRAVLEPRAGLQPCRAVTAEARGELGLVGLLQVPDRAQAELGQPVGGLRADPWYAARRRGGETHARLLAAHGDETGGLAGVAAALGDQPRRPDADRDHDPRPLLDGGDHLAQHAQRRLDSGEVREHLVNPIFGTRSSRSPTIPTRATPPYGLFASVSQVKHQTTGLDDGQARRARLLLLGKGAVLALRASPRFAAGMDDDQQS